MLLDENNHPMPIYIFLTSITVLPPFLIHSILLQQSPIEATVTKLLVATKQLLEGLTLWSTRKMSEEQVSDIFVQLATQFNLASQSFHEVGIDTR